MGNLRKRRPVLFTAGPALSLAVVLTIGLWAALFGIWSIWPWLVCWLVALNPVTVATYGLDKWLARQDSWRVPERTLFLLALLGGSPGAYLAMRVFRHKTIKGPFRIVFWLIVAAQVVLIACAAKVAWTKA